MFFRLLLFLFTSMPNLSTSINRLHSIRNENIYYTYISYLINNFFPPKSCHLCSWNHLQGPILTKPYFILLICRIQGLQVIVLKPGPLLQWQENLQLFQIPWQSHHPHGRKYYLPGVLPSYINYFLKRIIYGMQKLTDFIFPLIFQGLLALYWLSSCCQVGSCKWQILCTSLLFSFVFSCFLFIFLYFLFLL